MRLSFWDRVLAALYVVLSLCLCVLEALRSLGIDAVGRFYANLTAATGYWYFIYFGFLIIILLLGVFVLRLVFARRSRRSDFVTVDAGEKGKIIVAMDALQEMVRQASTRAEGVSDMNIHVEGHEDSISVLMELTAEGGAHLPTVTMNLQRDIREYVETNCGVAVRDVTVKVAQVLPPAGKAQAAAEQGRKNRESPWRHKKQEQPVPASVVASETPVEEETPAADPVPLDGADEEMPAPAEAGYAPVEAEAAPAPAEAEEAEMTEEEPSSTPIAEEISAEEAETEPDLAEAETETDAVQTVAEEEADAIRTVAVDAEAEEENDDDEEDYPRWLND